MQTLTVKRQLKHYPLSWAGYELQMDTLEVNRTRKYRFYQPYPVYFPTLRMPILTNKHLSILGSLAVLRFPEGTKQAFQTRGLN